MKKAEKNQYEEAQIGIDQMINYIQSNKKARKEKMESLVSDLQNIKSKCSKQEYQNEGKKWMKSAQIAHSKQNNYAYSNCVQQQMVFEQKSKKSKNWNPKPWCFLFYSYQTFLFCFGHYFISVMN